jgi:hypothetical protein
MIKMKRTCLLNLLWILLIAGCTQHGKPLVNESRPASNLFFFKDSITRVQYNGRFLTDTLIEKEITLHVIEKAILKHGIVYELKLDSVENIPDDRLLLGSFYVRNDKIFKLSDPEKGLQDLKANEDGIAEDDVVCQDSVKKDKYKEDEEAWHQYIERDGNKCIYHAYNNQVTTGYYESFTWEKGKGLISYWSGFGAERDGIELQLKQ